MRGEMTEAAIGLCVVVAGALFVAGAFHDGDDADADGYRVSITVVDASGLTEGADVRMAGIKVGEVADMNLLPNSYNAEVGLDINDGIELPTDTSARILPTGLVGHAYVELEPGGDDQLLAGGDVITGCLLCPGDQVAEVFNRRFRRN